MAIWLKSSASSAPRTAAMNALRHGLSEIGSSGSEAGATMLARGATTSAARSRRSRFRIRARSRRREAIPSLTRSLKRRSRIWARRAPPRCAMYCSKTSSARTRASVGRAATAVIVRRPSCFTRDTVTLRRTSAGRRGGTTFAAVCSTTTSIENAAPRSSLPTSRQGVPDLRAGLENRRPACLWRRTPRQRPQSRTLSPSLVY